MQKYCDQMQPCICFHSKGSRSNISVRPSFANLQNHQNFIHDYWWIHYPIPFDSRQRQISSPTYVWKNKHIQSPTKFTKSMNSSWKSWGARTRTFHHSSGQGWSIDSYWRSRNSRCLWRYQRKQYQGYNTPMYSFLSQYFLKIEYC